MAKSSILNIDHSVELKNLAPTLKRAQTSLPPSPSTRPVVPARVKRRGPIIAGGIIRMDLARPSS
jgi:hypothetical protein